MSKNSKELAIKYHGNGDKPRKKKNPNVADMSKQGYRDDSPYNTLPYIDIHTTDGVIDMSATGIPLLANGRYLPPYSGLHKFTEKVVREVPIRQAKEGGWLDKYQGGGATKIYTDKAEFDRANRAYRDSLSLYKGYKKDGLKSEKYSSILSPVIKYIPYDKISFINDNDAFDDRDINWKDEAKGSKQTNKDQFFSKNKIKPIGFEKHRDEVSDSEVNYYNAVYKKPVVKPIYKSIASEVIAPQQPVVHMATPKVEFEKPPIMEIRMQDGNMMSKEDFIKRHGEAQWKRATNQMQLGGATKPSLKFIKDFMDKQAAAEQYMDKSTGTTLKERVAAAGINPLTSKPIATGKTEEMGILDDPIFNTILLGAPGLSAAIAGRLGGLTEAAIVKQMSKKLGTTATGAALENAPKALPKKKNPNVQGPIESQLTKDTKSGMSIVTDEEINEFTPEMLEQFKKYIMDNNYQKPIKPGWSNKLNLSEIYPGLSKADRPNSKDILYKNVKELADDVEYNEEYNDLFADFMTNKTPDELRDPANNIRKEFEDLYGLKHRYLKTPSTKAQNEYLINRLGWDYFKERNEYLAGEALNDVKHTDKASDILPYLRMWQNEWKNDPNFNEMKKKLKEKLKDQLDVSKPLRFGPPQNPTKWNLELNKKGGETGWLDKYK